MKLKFLFPGKTKESFLDAGIQSYLKRLAPLVEVSLEIVKPAQLLGQGLAAEAAARQKESESLAARLNLGEHLIIADLAGQQKSSTQLADYFRTLQTTGPRNINLIVGGPWGLDPKLLAQAHLRLCFSPMTFPHDLARLMLLEQVYRAFTILNHVPYHK